MPVTVKLSKRFYDTFGEDIANEFVEWFNLVDTTYRTEIRELFGANFDRFDAKLEQRIAELRADLRTEFERRVAELRTELRLGIAGLDAKLGQRTTEGRAELREGLALLEGRLVARMSLSETRLVRWMFVFWAASVGTSIALIQLAR